MEKICSKVVSKLSKSFNNGKIIKFNKTDSNEERSDKLVSLRESLLPIKRKENLSEMFTITSDKPKKVSFSSILPVSWEDAHNQCISIDGDFPMADKSERFEVESIPKLRTFLLFDRRKKKLSY